MWSAVAVAARQQARKPRRPATLHPLTCPRNMSAAALEAPLAGYPGALTPEQKAVRANSVFHNRLYSVWVRTGCNASHQCVRPACAHCFVVFEPQALAEFTAAANHEHIELVKFRHEDVENFACRLLRARNFNVPAALALHARIVGWWTSERIPELLAGTMDDALGVRM